MYFLIEGRVKIGSYVDIGKEIIKVIFNKGEVFGELLLIGEEKCWDFVYVMEDVFFCIFIVVDMKVLMCDYNVFNFFFMKIMGFRMFEME